MLIWANVSPWQHGPFGPHGPFGSQGQNPPPPPPPNVGQAGVGGSNPFPPAAGTPPPPYSNVSGFAGGPDPQNWKEWRQQQKWEQRRQKWEQRRQRRTWKQQWTGQNWWGNPSGYESNESQFSYSAVLSHVERNITAKNFKSGTVSAFFGGFDIDLSRADIEGDEAVILADAFFGGGEIRIPETWHVIIEGSALFGAFMDETRQRPPDGTTAAKRLVIRGTALFGGISIQN